MAGGKKGGGPSKQVHNDSSSKDKSKNTKSAPSKNNRDQKADENVAQKPDVRSLIGGSSWTGKLPVTLLSEHCRKQKWGQPTYSMHRTAQGFSSQVTLTAINPKTKDTVVLPQFVTLPPSLKHLAIQETPVEARHFAATFSLFRVCNMKNVHVMLPPHYKALWKGEFQDLKQEDMKQGNGYLYESDPFAAKLERDEAKAHAAKARENAEINRFKGSERMPGMSLSIGGSGGASGWSNLPTVDMGERMRLKIETMVRKKTRWNTHRISILSAERVDILRELELLGFRKSHIEEAIEECGSRNEVLDWLLVYVPEDDLPSWSLPQTYSANIKIASGNIKRDAAIQRLAAAGYNSDVCARTLDHLNGDERQAATALQNMLLYGHELEHIPVNQLQDSPQSNDAWKEELETLEAIYGPRFARLDPGTCEIELDIPAQTGCKVQFQNSRGYPSNPPVISLTGRLPAYIRLSIYRQAIKHACDVLLDESMLFSLVDWLEAEIPRITDSPGTLKEVTDIENRVTRIPLRNAHQTKAGSPRSAKSFDAECLAIFNEWEERRKSSRYQGMLADRRKLPAWELRDAAVREVDRYQVTIVKGETGSGKSTQIVQFILDDMIERKHGSATNIICTQPRRISALALADRVSEERCAQVGNEVGYTIRGESRCKAGTTKITFVTTGVLLRMLQNPGKANGGMVAALAHVSHVVVDEVHERSLDTDFLLILLKAVLRARRDLKVILMSATLDAAAFEDYFKEFSVGKLEIRGRTFPVDDYYLDDVVEMINRGKSQAKISVKPSSSEDTVDIEPVPIGSAIQRIGMGINYNIIRDLVMFVDSRLEDAKGGILIFLPGIAEINRALNCLQHMANIYALPLHASLTPSEQRRVFPPAPGGKRKVIVSTNVAETSVTIQDVVVVIDSGRVKETSFEDNIVKLKEVWASRAACKQRKGRAGRIRRS